MLDCCNITGYTVACNEEYVNPVTPVKFNIETKEVFDKDDNLIGIGTFENGILKFAANYFILSERNRALGCLKDNRIL